MKNSKNLVQKKSSESIKKLLEKKWLNVILALVLTGLGAALTGILFKSGIGNRKYLNRWSERLGIANIRPTADKSIVWVHAVSVGEVNASIPLLRKLLDEYTDSEFLVTTSTPTGSDILLSKLGNKVKHQYVPLDIPFCINLFLNTWK